MPAAGSSCPCLPAADLDGCPLAATGLDSSTAPFPHSPGHHCCQLAHASGMPCSFPALIFDSGRRRARGGTGDQAVGGGSRKARWAGPTRQWSQKVQTSSPPDPRPRPQRVRWLHSAGHLLPLVRQYGMLQEWMIDAPPTFFADGFFLAHLVLHLCLFVS
jgi:hypothetical protein